MVKSFPIGKGWSKNSVNAVIFRKNSIVSFQDQQFVAYYDTLSRVVVASRALNSRLWNVKITPFSGNTRDAHNAISLMVDGNGLLHMAWDHHNNPLNYSVTTHPGSLEFKPKNRMVGTDENRVTYPEFYSFSNGDLLFVYRDGSSGNGNLIMNLFDHNKREWIRLHSNLIDGEGQRNAYWQLCIDQQDHIHLSWVWRETGDVATNHDICYAYSSDRGHSWKNSKEKSYQIPINEARAEIILPIPQGSNLMNQTSMTYDAKGSIYIANYFKKNPSSNTQYQVIFQNGEDWQVISPGHRTGDFNLQGGGTRSLPISRPQIITMEKEGKTFVILLFRDEALDNSVCVAYCSKDDWIWHTRIAYPSDVNRWEPTYDTELWKHKNKLHLFVQYVGQEDNEKMTNISSSQVQVVEIDLLKMLKAN